MKEVIREYQAILSKKEKRNIVGLMFMMIVGSVLELLGITLIMPLMNMLMQQEESGLASFLADHGIFTAVSPVIAVSLAVILVYVIKNVYLYLMYKTIFHFIYKGYKDLSVRLLSGYLREKYELHTQRNMGVIQR